MSSETDICNLGILKVGHKTLITSLNEDSMEAKLCNWFYGPVRDAVLRSHPWNCAIQRASITALTESPVCDYDYQYQLPTNPWCLRVLQVGEVLDQPVVWTVEGRRLLCNESSTPLVYVKRITDTNEFDPMLEDTLVLKMAIKLSMPLSNEPKIQAALINELEKISLPEARSVDGQEQSVQQLEADTWVDSRL